MMNNYQIACISCLEAAVGKNRKLMLDSGGQRNKLHGTPRQTIKNT